jgi:pimeloyl-ACP methyl ester carboxylesterase
MVNRVWTLSLLLLLAASAVWGEALSREELRELNRYESLPAEARSNYVEVRGKNLHYYEMGDGPAILLLHDFPTHSYVWRHVMPRLAFRYHVYALDLAGYGKSTVPPNTDRSVGAQVSYVVDWMEAVGLDSSIVVGEGIGGAIGIIMGARYPRKLRGLVLINPACYDSWPSQYANLLKEPGWGSFLGTIGWARRAGFKSNLRKGIYYSGELLSEGVIDGYYEPWQGSEGRRNLVRAAEDLDSRITQDIVPELSTIRSPTLVIAGMFDPFQHTNYSRRLAADIPGAQFVVIPDCGHFAAEDEPEKLVKYIFDFFR